MWRAPEGAPLELAKVQEVAPELLVGRGGGLRQVRVEAAVVPEVEALGAALVHERNRRQLRVVQVAERARQDVLARRLAGLCWRADGMLALSRSPKAPARTPSQAALPVCFWRADNILLNSPGI